VSKDAHTKRLTEKEMRKAIILCLQRKNTIQGKIKNVIKILLNNGMWGVFMQFHLLLYSFLKKMGVLFHVR
jgi:hypothetical protein